MSIWWNDAFAWIIRVYTIIRSIYHKPSKKHHTIPHIESGLVDDHHIVSMAPIPNIEKEDTTKTVETPKEEIKEKIPEIEEKIIESTTDETATSSEIETIEKIEDIPEIETPVETTVTEDASTEAQVAESPIIPEEPVIETIPEETIQTETIIEPPVKKPKKEKSAPEKIDTSKVEKLTNLVSSIKTLIARGMMTEAQTLIIE